MVYQEFVVIGRAKPTEADAQPKIYRLRIFAKTELIAKSRFIFFLRTTKKVKAAHGEVLAVHKISERNPRHVKNYGIWLRYRSASNQHNLYKEYRDVSRAGAVTQLYNDMAGRHRASYSAIQIIDIKEIDPKDCRRENVKQFHNASIRFPLPHRVLRASHPKFKTTFKAHRPITHLG